MSEVIEIPRNNHCWYKSPIWWALICGVISMGISFSSVIYSVRAPQIPMIENLRDGIGKLDVINKTIQDVRSTQQEQVDRQQKVIVDINEVKERVAKQAELQLRIVRSLNALSDKVDVPLGEILLPEDFPSPER